MKNIFKLKKTYILLLILIGAGYFGYTRYQASQKPPQYDTVKAEKGTLIQSVDATGKVESAQDLSLKFELPGTLGVVNVKEGDNVKAGTLLATLRMSDLNAAVAQAQANLNKQLAGNTPEYLAQLQANLDKAKNDLSQAQGNGDGVENSKLVQNAYDNLVLDLQALQITLASSLTAADNILGVDNTLANDSFEQYLSTLDSNWLNQSKSKYLSAKAEKNKFDIDVNSISTASPHPSIDLVVQSAEKAVVALKDCLYFTSGVLDSTAPVGTLTQSSLDTMKTNIQTARSNLSTKYSTLVGQTHAIVTARNNYFSLQTLVDKAEAALKDAQNPPRAVDVASYRAALQQALANREKASIIAPIDGIITQVNYKVGESVGGTDPVIKLLSPNYQIKVDISESDIAKLKVGNLAVITLDAFGEETKFKGTITNIDPGATNIQDVVYYKVTLSLEDNDKAVKPGMTANVIIETDKRENVIIIPSRAVRTDNGKYVRILEKGQEKQAPVKLGMKGNDAKVEVLEGLKGGEEIILGIKQ